MNIRCIIYLLLPLLVVVVGAATEGYCGERDDGTAQFGFAESLFNEGDFYRAIGEYKRFIYLYPNEKDHMEEAVYKIALAYQHAAQWQEAIGAFDAFIQRFTESSKIPEALYLKGKAEYNLERYREALVSYERAAAAAPSALKHKIIFESALLLVDLKDWTAAGEMLARIPRESMYSRSAATFSEGLERIDQLPQKSPATAGTLAAIIPGAGHVYTERYRDALVAFILNGAFIWGAIELFDNDDDVAGGIVTFFELGWYGGNIYSAVSSAHKYNVRTQESFIEGLKRRSAISFKRDEKANAGYLVVQCEF